MDISQLKREFSNPPAKYTPAPFWFLNHELSDEELIWQINEMNNNGVKGFIMHARHGLITEYLSEDWFRRIETCVKEADKLGMKAYLYDENNWPSGPVDGILLAQHPEYRMSACVVSQQFSANGGKKIKQKIDAKNGLIAVVAVPTEKNVLVGLPQSAVLLDSFVEDGVLEWTAPEDVSRWTVFVFARHIFRGWTFFDGYLDTLNKDAVAKFIEMTHERYTERFEKYYGGTVDGIFTDEPMMSGLGTENGVPYTPTMPGEFGWRHGYDYWRVLPAVFADAGCATAQLRCDFYDTATHMYQQAFFKQIFEYCEPKRLNLIGHVLYEGEMYEHSHYQGDFFRGAAFMHWGGCDQLCDVRWPTPGQPGLNNLLGPKLASSAAHIFNKPRVMSECFGLAGSWRVDLRQLKTLTDWLVAMGVNYIQPHAFYYSIQGERKWECPPGEFYQSAFWDYYRYFADYVARLCNIFSGGRHVADVAVIYPTRSLWTTKGPERTEETQRLIRGFETVTSALLRAGYDFDLLPEESLIWESSPDLQHFASGESYKVLVVPYITTLLEETAHFIEEAIEMGTNVVVVGEPPKHTVMNSDAQWTDYNWSGELFADLFGLEYDEKSGQLNKRPVPGGGESAVIIPDMPDADEFAMADVLSQVLGQMFVADVKVRDLKAKKEYIPDIVHCHYKREENDFFFLVNTSREQGYFTEVTLDTIGVPSIWNPETGEVAAISDYDFDGERIKVKLEFEPCESYVISVTTAPVSEQEVDIAGEPKYGKIIELSDTWQFCTDKPNCLPLADWKYEMATGGGGDVCGFTNVYTTEFECDAELDVARLAVDGLLTEKIWRRSQSIHVEITLNDEPVAGFAPGDYIDHHIMEADIQPLVKRGKNVLKIRCNTQLAPAGNLSHPVYLIGNFELHKHGEKYKVVPQASEIKTGDWSKHGYPFYSGVATYCQTIEIPRTSKKVYLKMDKPGDLAEVIVNGEFAATLLWEPWIVDITDLVKAGKNEITIKVANSMANVFRLETKPSGIFGKVEIAVAK